MATILPPAKTTFFDDNGDPLALGYVHFYIPGTLTRKNTWQDSALTILNDNPVRLDAAGRALIYGTGAYRQIITDVTLTQEWDQPTEGFASDADLIGQYTTQIFNSPGDFTPGTTTFLTLTESPLPLTEASLDVHFDGVFQMPTTYSLSGDVITFTSAIQTGVLAVAVRWATPFTDGTFVIPAGSVTTAMLADGAVTEDKIADSAVTEDKLSPDAIHGQPTDTALSLTDEVLTWETLSSELRKATLQSLFNVVGQLATVTPELAEDFVVIYEGDSTSAKKVTLSALQTAIGSSVSAQIFSGSGTWTRPASGTIVMVRAWGAGGSGSSAASGTSGGGGGGAYVERFLPFASLGATETVTIGVGGASTATAVGNPGGNTTFGALVTAYGGGGGHNSTGGGGGGGAFSAGTSPTGGTLGGGAGGVGAPGSIPTSEHGGAGGGHANQVGGNSMFGGAGGGGSNSFSVAAGGTSLFGGNGGASAGINGVAGSIPGGGGGGTFSLGNSGPGGDGRCEVYVW